uniref:Uncharacterized protein n=1 Tax=Meloidogyne enterolobii TaxID=390850 RepID=A0A6V7Y1U3_MELEN|nr:unnamed protein product [Meloidogyne enterolobii]
MSNSFFVFLPSNVPDYSSNRPNKFRVHLPKPLYFNGNWVCGLHSISYPYSWPSTIGTLDEQWLKIHFTDDLGQKHILRIPIPGASHTNVQKLSDFLNSTLKHQITAIDHVFDPDSSSKDLIVSPPRLEKRIKRHVPSSPPPVPKESQLSSPPRIADVKKELNKGQKVIVPPSPPKTVDKNVQKLDEGNKKIKLTQDQPKQEKYVAQPNNEGKIKTNENVPSQKPLKTDGQKVQTKNEKSQIKGEKVITTPTPTKIEKDRKDPEPKSLEKIENDRIKKTIVTPVITTPFFSLGLAEIEEDENNKTNKEEEEFEFTIGNENVLDNNNYSDSSKFLLLRGGIRLSGNLTLLKNIIDSINFEYNIDFARFRLLFTHENIDHISLSPQLGYVLGFENPQYIKNKEVAKYGSDLRGGFSSFAVYANGLTENMIIGNSLSSLLRVVSVSGATPGEYNEKIYDTPIYARVLPREINEIEIELRTLDNGRLVPFAYGTVLIVLIFKKVINF